MKPILTTITPYWNRSEMLDVWEKAVQGAFHPLVRHLVFMVGEPMRVTELPNPAVEYVYVRDVPGEKSIGHYHNLGAERADTEWVMKLDVDCIPNAYYFQELVKVLRESIDPTDWFNGGMFYMNRASTTVVLGKDHMPLGPMVYQNVMQERRSHTNNAYLLPAATNFITRRENYLAHARCDDRFMGYGWEDYQQIYMLERAARGGEDPLPGEIHFSNVSNRCRDEISRPKAAELYSKSPWLCLLHRWHEGRVGAGYKNSKTIHRNREVLLQCILDARRMGSRKEMA